MLQRRLFARHFIRRMLFGLWKVTFPPLIARTIKKQTTRIDQRALVRCPWNTASVHLCNSSQNWLLCKATQESPAQYGSSRKYLKILTLTVAKLQTYGEKPQKCAWKILDYVIRWLLCDVPRNRAIVWALFVSICVLFSICLVSAGNSEGAQEVLRKLHGGGCVISFQRLKLPREIFH